jgi:hypothetical protein
MENFPEHLTKVFPIPLPTSGYKNEVQIIKYQKFSDPIDGTRFGPQADTIRKT